MLFGKVIVMLVLAATLVIGINWYTSGVIAGKARVVDGDTLDVGNQRVHLFGIDAPELSQVCKFADRYWDCGHRARDSLAKYVEGGTITCRSRGPQSKVLVSAVCYKNAVSDLGAYQIDQGMAVAETEFSEDYVDGEQVAQKNLKGIWSSTFDLPWLYRKDHQR